MTNKNEKNFKIGSAQNMKSRLLFSFFVIISLKYVIGIDPRAPIWREMQVCWQYTNNDASIIYADYCYYYYGNQNIRTTTGPFNYTDGGQSGYQHQLLDLLILQQNVQHVMYQNMVFLVNQKNVRMKYGIKHLIIVNNLKIIKFHQIILMLDKKN